MGFWSIIYNMNLQTFLRDFIIFVNEYLIPLLLAIAFIVFLWNIVRYFIIGGGNPEDQEKAKSVAMWGIFAFAIILSIWGIVNLFVGDLGFSGQTDPVTPDYMQGKNIENAVEDGFDDGTLPF